MKFLRVCATVLGIVPAYGSYAQDGIPPATLLSQTKKVLQGAWKGAKLGAAAHNLYSGGVEYGGAVTNPGRNEQQTKDGAAGGLQAVGAGASIAGTIGGRLGGFGATAMTVPIGGGMVVMPEWVGQANKMGRILELIDKGDGKTLELEHTERVKQAQAAGDAYKATANNLIMDPNGWLSTLAAKIDGLSETVASLSAQTDPDETTTAPEGGWKPFFGNGKGGQIDMSTAAPAKQTVPKKIAPVKKRQAGRFKCFEGNRWVEYNEYKMGCIGG